MDWDKAKILLIEGDKLWDKLDELNEKYGGQQYLDGGASWSLMRTLISSSETDAAGFGEGTFRKDYNKYLRESVKCVKESQNTIRKNMREKTWEEHLPEELKTLEKEEVIRRYTEDFDSLLNEYENLLTEVKNLKKEP